MGYFSGLIALAGLAAMLFSVMDRTINVFILDNIGLTVGLILLIVGFIGFLGTFNKSAN
jgi:hypothetical protein